MQQCLHTAHGETITDRNESNTGVLFLGSSTELFGWVISACTWLSDEQPVPALERYFRSIFRLLLP